MRQIKMIDGIDIESTLIYIDGIVYNTQDKFQQCQKLIGSEYRVYATDALVLKAIAIY